MSEQRFHTEILPLRHAMYRYALKILHEEARALDAVQDVLMRMWEKRSDLDRVDHLKAFCMRSIRNQCINMIKHNKRFVADEILDGHENGEMNPMEHTHSRQMVDEIMDCIEALPDDQRDCMHLREIEGYSYKEIAEVLKLTLSQVKVNIHRGRKKVQEQLNEKSLMP